ncbi:MAG: GntR family transcriptional regulator [Gammaproteobacteria bacterium]|nr:GntR family transcriptional regulator [Gammaproteobacteria bacterium]
MLTTGKGSISLYMQIKELLTTKIGKGEWLPGSIIPSEINLAQELGVSQGTVRKAITELVENNVLMRKQGRGTFVSIHDTDRALFHFFHITDNNNHKVLPDSRVLHCRTKPASRMEAAKLHLAAGTDVVRIERVRSISAKPTMIETITLPAGSFDDLGREGNCDLPNTLYELYEKRFGITIHSADEQLRAVVASKHDGKILNLEVGTPLLEIERVALTLDKTPVELRISRCSTRNHHYHNTIF